ncbi:MAG: phenylpyruvate tautomerase MIF-related protein [Methylococcales bacterium]|nr:phenylpyruvate tautomerase MIF-related protein [Methylococcales bacterium]
MPYTKLNTNVEIADKPKILRQLSQLLAKETSKPESYVMVEIAHNPNMLFAGTSDPLAYFECKSIGLTEKQAKVLSASLCQLLNAELQIPTDRIYIEFSNAPAAFWGYNGSTFG